MQFLNYTILDKPHRFVLIRDDVELGYYATLLAALQDLEHRYNLQSRTEDEKMALRAFIAQQTVLSQHS